MTMDVTGAWASNALWPDSGTTRKSNTDYDALARRAAADDAKSSAPAGQLAATRRATPSGFSQNDFELATRFGQSVLPQSLQQLTGLQKIEREPWHGADKAASNPYGNILGSLRRAALRRDAAAPAVPSADETAGTAEQATAESTAGSTTGTSLTVSTAIAAYTAAAQSGGTPSTTTPSGDTTAATPPGETTSAPETTSSGGTTTPGGTTETTTTGGTTSAGGTTATGGTTTPTSPADWWKIFFGRH